MKKAIFITAFLLFYLIGGFINYFGILPFKMAYVSFLPFIMLPFFNLKNNLILWSSIFFGIIIILSGIINHTRFELTILYLQNAVTPYLIYYLTVHYINRRNVYRVFNWCIFIGCIQLPIVLLQRNFYDIISKYGSRYVLKEDFGFGTFYTSNDPSLAFFIFGLILFLLFDQEHNYFIRRRKLLITWLVATILVLNSKLSLIILTLIFIYYFLKDIRIKTIIITGVSICSLIIILWKLITYNPQLYENVNGLINLVQSTQIDLTTAEKHYKEGLGNRVYSLVYLMSQPISFIGNGPYFSLDPFTKIYHRGGDSGHLINFYINLGIIGLISGYLVAFSFLHSKPFSKFVILYFLVLCTFFTTVEIFIDGSILMTFHILTSSFLIPRQDMEATAKSNSEYLLSKSE